LPLVLVVPALALVAAVVTRLLVGPAELSVDVLLDRGVRVISGGVVGAALAIAGVLLQCLLRNPLASPDLLGLASGAGLGVMLAIYAGFLMGLGIADTGGLPGWVAAVVGAMGSLALAWAASQRRGVLDPFTLVLVGVVVSIVCSAGMTLVRHLLPDQGLAAGRLLLGAIRDDGSAAELWAVGVATLVCGVVACVAGPTLDTMSIGEDEARSLGVPVGSVRTLLFVGSGILAAGSVVLAGPVGFVGLICPHLIRVLGGPAHRWLVPGAAMAGAALVIGSDALVRVIDLGSGRIPITVVTSLVGGPLLVWMLRRGPERVV
jgi:iron complex transport system permease protein